jgi:hypothetical protein
MRKTVTKSWVSKEPLAVTTTVSRGDDGQLHGRLEPVYYDIPKTSSMLLGCEPQVFTCKGYMYVNKSRDSYMCLDKPISSIRMILFRDAAQWTEVF